MSTSEDLKRLKKLISQLPAGRSRRFPPAVLELMSRHVHRRRDAGDSKAAIATELGVAYPTIVRALQMRSKPLVPVRVVEDKTTSRGATVRTSSGLLIEGLDINAIAALIEALS